MCDRWVLLRGMLVAQTNEMDHSVTELSNSWCLQGLYSHLQIVKGYVFSPLIDFTQLK